VLAAHKNAPVAQERRHQGSYEILADKSQRFKPSTAGAEGKSPRRKNAAGRVAVQASLSQRGALHLGTTNVIESVFATVRLRTEMTKRSGTRVACLTMIFKLMQSASRRWRPLNGSARLVNVIKGVVFVHGIKKEDAARSQPHPQILTIPQLGGVPEGAGCA
jgi:hypothetical protein